MAKETIHLEEKDAALVVRENGSVELHVPHDDPSALATDASRLVGALAIAWQEDDLREEIIEVFEKRCAEAAEADAAKEAAGEKEDDQ